MNCESSIKYLYNLPAFERQGASSYKPGLGNTEKIDSLLSHPHRRYKTIHVAGTNGKGSVSHLIASALQMSGLKVGLYTSPHIADFRERIRVNGQKIDRQYVCDYVERYQTDFESIRPSFFEATMGMAFKYFADMRVDVAVIEVGLGGRLDSTNIIHPELSVITNISLDHMDMLGDTLEKIAAEKAGIIKPHTPAVIGEKGSVADVFIRKAADVQAPVFFAEDVFSAVRSSSSSCTRNSFDVTPVSGNPLNVSHTYNNLLNELNGGYQIKNTVTALAAVEVLRQLGFSISDDDVRRGFSSVCSVTGLTGRWQKLSSSPDVICDMGHNEGAMRYIVEQLRNTRHKQLRIIFGMVRDKDVDTVLSLMPDDAVYYFCNAPIHRALPAGELRAVAMRHGLSGNSYSSPLVALRQAQRDASADDLIFIGGSAYVLAEVIGKVNALND